MLGLTVKLTVVRGLGERSAFLITVTTGTAFLVILVWAFALGQS